MVINHFWEVAALWRWTIYRKNILGRLGLHEHLCVIYDTQDAQFAAA